MATFKPGDRVAYSRAYLKKLGERGYDVATIASVRGTIVRLCYPVRGSNGAPAWYRVQWDDTPDETTHQLSTSLARVVK